MSSPMAPVVLLTGGSGLIGQALKDHLLQKGYGVRNLSRSPQESDLARYQEYRWNPKENYIDPSALDGVSSVINMAGAGVNDQRWTTEYKKIIRNSRIDSTRCIVNHIKAVDRKVKFISLSATGIYGDRGASLIDENAELASDPEDFLAQVCKEWEHEALRIPCTLLRVPPVISALGGALPTLVAKNKYGVIARLDKPENYFSWIHISDLISIISLALKEETSDIINTCSPYPVTNDEMMTDLKGVYHLKGPKLTIPKWIIQLMVGGVATELCKSIRVHSLVMEEKGFQFAFPTFQEAITEARGFTP